ncbi:aldehyde dehydrogenase family protein [Mycolicibacterium sp.]|uniref:aldehyde dehydrogenase family protein n=1 Tax=Mycolicibacterium sp. TaxID=2320850 RepID=UPI003D1381C3
MGRGLTNDAGEPLDPATATVLATGRTSGAADVGTAVQAATAALPACALGNAGQDCTASSRLLVHRSVYDGFLERLVAAVSAVRIGPTDDDTELGPLISAAQRSRVETLIDGRSSGSRLLTGGGRPRLPGFYLQPTVIADVEQSEPLVQQEIFGPVITVQPFDTDSDALAMANGTRYGLAASVWTAALSRAHTFSNALAAGTVWVNDHTLFSPDVPQGGYADSGYGKENGLFGAEELTRRKQISVNAG